MKITPAHDFNDFEVGKRHKLPQIAVLTKEGKITFADDASDTPQSVAASGTGTAPAVGLSPGTLTFPNQRVGTTSATQTITASVTA